MTLFRNLISDHLTPSPFDEAIRDTHAGMAHFAGTGPDGKTCGNCVHRGYSRESRVGRWNEALQQIVHRSYRVTKCAMFKRLTGNHGSDIAKEFKACKYFGQKP